jgi:hypothetical protein
MFTNSKPKKYSNEEVKQNIDILFGGAPKVEYLDVKSLDPNKVAVYEKWVPNKNDDSQLQLYRKICLLDGHGKCHKYVDFNKFTKELYELPNGEWKLKKDNHKWIEEFICNPSVKYFIPTPNIYDIHGNYKRYNTLDNGAVGFVVLINDHNEVFVYGRLENRMVPEEYLGDEFENLIGSYKPLEIFIGKSPLNEMTDFSGGHGDKFDGNTVLLRVKSPNEKFKYVYIGIDIYEFYTDEPIIKYVSSVGNSSVTYAYAETANWGYSMGMKQKTLLSEHEDRDKRGYLDYESGAKYIDYDTKEIAGRNSEIGLYMDIPFEEKTGVVKLIKSVKATIPSGTSAKN